MEPISWILFYCLLPILLGVLGNILTPWAIALLSKGNLSIRERRINSILSDYRSIEMFRKYHLGLIVHILGFVLYSILLGILTVIVVGVVLVPPDFGIPRIFQYYLAGGYFFFMILFTTFVAIYHVGLISRVYRAKAYKEKTIAKLQKLGLGQDEIDKLLEEK